MDHLYFFLTFLNTYDDKYLSNIENLLIEKTGNEVLIANDLAEDIFGTATTPNYGPFYYVTDENVTDTMYMTTPEDYFMEMLQVDILDSEIIVYLDFGYRPQLWCRKTKRNLNY